MPVSSASRTRQFLKKTLRENCLLPLYKLHSFLPKFILEETSFELFIAFMLKVSTLNLKTIYSYLVLKQTHLISCKILSKVNDLTSITVIRTLLIRRRRGKDANPLTLKFVMLLKCWHRNHQCHASCRDETRRSSEHYRVLRLTMTWFSL